jgi:hypothetical protein
MTTVFTAFAGMELTDEVHRREINDRNGTLTSYEVGRKRVGSAGEPALHRSRRRGDSGCYEVWLSGKKVELRRDASYPSPLEGALERPAGR